MTSLPADQVMESAIFTGQVRHLTLNSLHIDQL